MILVLLYILLPALQVVIYLYYNYAFDLIEVLNFTTSITTLLWMLANVLIASKVPLLQRLIPYDRRIKAHILSSIGIVCFTLYHGSYKYFVGYDISVAIPLAIVLALFMVISLLWTKKISKNYDLNKKIHVYTQPILGVILFYHIYTAELFSDIPIYSSAIYIVMFILAYGGFILSKTHIFRYECKVSSIERVKDIYILELKTFSPLKYSSGQFSFLSFRNSNGVLEEHPFSFLSEGGNKSIQFGIKILGDFTESLSEVKIGDTMWLRGSFGDFRPDFNSERHITLIGSGIGIVPIISLIKEIRSSHIEKKVSIFLSVDDKQELLGAEEFHDLDINYLVYNDDKQLFTKEYFEKELDHTENSDFYLCSSPGVRKVVMKILKELGVKRQQINYEAFSF